MTSILLSLTGAQAWATVDGPLTSGMVGIPITIEYDEAWNGLTKNLMCRCSPWGSNDGEIRTLLNVGETTTVAHEVIQPDMYLYLGVEGFSDDGKLVIPTTWAKCGKIEYGANTCEDLSTEPELPIWNQLQSEIEQINRDGITQERMDEIRACAETAAKAAVDAERSELNAAASASFAINSTNAAESFAAQAKDSEQNARTSASSAANLANGALQAQRAAEAAAERAEAAAGSLSDPTQKEVTETVTVGGDAVVLDSTAPEQVVNLAWTVDGARTVPAFDNYYIAKSGITYPRAFDTAQYVQFFSPSYHGDESAFAAGHQYFQAMHYRMDGDSTAQLQGWSNPITQNGQATLSGSGWCYGVSNPTSISSASFALKNTGTGTGTIDYVYCIDITAMQEAGTIPADITTAELAELFGELPLVPGEDYPGGTIGDGAATLSINRGGSVSTVDNTSGTATVKGGDVLSVEGGSVTFMLKTYKTVSADESGEWEGIKWVAFGDSLTDGSINADTKYHKLIAGKTGITVVDMGKGGTGYWRRNDEGTAFYQRMANVPADADIITIFGSVNDWMVVNSGVAYGEATDTIEDGTLAGYINECIDVAIEKAPYAQIALITPMDYHGIPDDAMENIANIIVDVAKRRKIKCVDMYHSSGFRVDDPVYAAVYCTDYSETAETYGHPSNLAHEKIIAPEFMELLRRMIL